MIENEVGGGPIWDRVVRKAFLWKWHLNWNSEKKCQPCERQQKSGSEAAKLCVCVWGIWCVWPSPLGILRLIACLEVSEREAGTSFHLSTFRDSVSFLLGSGLVVNGWQGQKHSHGRQTGPRSRTCRRSAWGWECCALPQRSECSRLWWGRSHHWPGWLPWHCLIHRLPPRSTAMETRQWLESGVELNTALGCRAMFLASWSFKKFP